MSTELTTSIAASLDAYKSTYEKKLEAFQKSHGGLVYDMAEEEQRKKARLDRREINAVVKSLDEEHDSIKAPFLEASKRIDATRKTIKDQFLELSNGIGDQLKAHEQAIQEKIDAISSAAEIDPAATSPEEIDAIIARVSGTEIDDSFFDKKADAALAKEKTLKTLEQFKTQISEREELERLRKEQEEREAKEREERMVREAEERARREAEEKAQAERQRQGEESRRRVEEAERQQKAAEERAEKAAQEERERIERERREAEEKAEAARKADEAKKARQEHRAKIHKQAKESFMENGLDETVSTAIVELIKDGKIKNVAINY